MKYYLWNKETDVIEETEDMHRANNYLDNCEGRSVGRDIIAKYRISTVCLASDHSFGSGGLPLIFETMVFDEEESLYSDRYTSPNEARKGHQKAIQWVRKQGVK